MNKLKQTDGRFQRNLLENVIIYKLKKWFIERNELDYTSKHGKTYNFSKYALSIVFYEIYERKLTLEEADNEQSKLVRIK